MARGLSDNIHYLGEGQGAHPNKFISKYLVDESNSNNMAVDASVSKSFKYVVPVGFVAMIARMNICVLDGESYPNRWGGISMSKGITFKIHDEDDSVMLDMTDGEAIKNTACMGLMSGTNIVFSSRGCAIEWDIEHCDSPVRISANQYISAVINDNLSGLDFFKIMVHGIYHCVEI
jgi:hypothetical protein